MTASRNKPEKHWNPDKRELIMRNGGEGDGMDTLKGIVGFRKSIMGEEEVYMPVLPTKMQLDEDTEAVFMMPTVGDDLDEGPLEQTAKRLRELHPADRFEIRTWKVAA